MAKGGIQYNARSDKWARVVGFIAPFLLIGYSFLIYNGTIPVDHPPQFYIVALISFWWVVVAVFQLVVRHQTQFFRAFVLIAYHLLAAAYILFIAGINSPITILWTLLIIAGYIYFSSRAVILSIVWFACILVLSTVIYQATSTSTLILGVGSLVAILLSGTFLLNLSRTAAAEQHAQHARRVRASFQRDRTDTIINNITDAIITTDRRGIIQMYNAATLNLLDTNDTLRGQLIDDVLKLVEQQTKKPVIFSNELATSHATVTRDDLLYTFSDGETMRLEITYSPIRGTFSRLHTGQTPEGFMMIMRDVTKAKSLEEERDEFISVVSHELRTPITIMEGSLSNLMLMMQQKLPVKQNALQESVTMAHDQALYLAKMVNDLSTLSRAERGVADNGEDIDVKTLLHTLHDEYHKDAAAKKLHLNLDLKEPLGTIHVSRLYVEELLQNFITNAIKYTKEGSITIVAQATKSHVTITVKDTGIGMSRSDQAKIFQKFYRSEDYRIRETSGTGLGLYVAEKLSHKLGTKIVMTSRLNHGSSFGFSLPLVKK